MQTQEKSTLPPVSTAPVPYKRKTFMQKKIPTLLGLGVLVVSLIAGLLFFSDGTGVFAPRATPQTTPKNIELTNVTDKSFTVSFYTDEKTVGFIKYGEDAESIKNQSTDDRDQLSGVVGKYSLHHITVRGLSPGKKYHYVLGTGSRSTFDQQGNAFVVKTAMKPKTPPPASKTIYGSVVTPGSTPAEGSIVYVSIEGVGNLSSLVRQSGSWAVALSNAWSKDGQSYAIVSDDDAIKIYVQGSPLDQTTNISTIISEAQPVPDMTLGQAGTATLPPTSKPPTSKTQPPSKTLPPRVTPVPDSDPATVDLSQFDKKTASNSGSLNDLLDTKTASNSANYISTASATLDLVDLENNADSTIAAVVVGTPKIVGKAPPMVTIKIEVHSDTQITETIQSDADGDFELDIAALSEGLEPGEHEVTYSYIDPETGEEITKTHTFMVEDTSQLIAQADTSSDTSTTSDYSTYDDSSSSTADDSSDDVPYGSGNPYPIEPTTAPTAISTRSAVVATSSSLPEAGSVGITLALIVAGGFFIFTGMWSWWLAGQVEEVIAE